MYEYILAFAFLTGMLFFVVYLMYKLHKRSVVLDSNQEKELDNTNKKGVSTQ